MPVPNSIDDLDTTPANNSPPGSESAKGNIDNYLRSAFAFIKQCWVAITAAKAIADAALPKSGGTMTGDIALGAHQITGLASPTASGNAISLDYADGRYPRLNAENIIFGNNTYRAQAFFQPDSPFAVGFGYGAGSIVGYIGASSDAANIYISNSGGTPVLSIRVADGALYTPQLGDFASAINARTPRNSQIYHAVGVAEFGPVYYGNGGSGPIDLPSPWVVVGMRATDGFLLYLRGTWLATP